MKPNAFRAAKYFFYAIQTAAQASFLSLSDTRSIL